MELSDKIPNSALPIPILKIQGLIFNGLGLLMINTAKAYLKTKGNVDYRGCAVNYYTFSMFDQPNKYKVNVNVELHHTQNNFIKTLALDEQFDKETAAINYGIEQGKKFIDHSYELGKVKIVKVNTALQNKIQENNKVKQEKNKTTKS